MQLHIRQSRKKPPLHTFKQAQDHRNAEKTRNAVKPDVLALSEAIAEQDETSRVDHKTEQPGDVVVTNHGLSYQAVSPYSRNIKWSPVTTNIEAARVVFRPEDGMLLSAQIELPERRLTFQAKPDRNIYQIETSLGQTSTVEENLTTGALSVLDSNPG